MVNKTKALVVKDETKPKKKFGGAQEGAGRPKVVIDEAILLQMAAEDCTVREIASKLGCCVDTIYARFSEVLQAGRDQGNCSIKRKMFEIAMSGNTHMLIFLSKQRLGYREQPTVEAQQMNFNVYVNEIPK
jgi:hypothetical protein